MSRAEPLLALRGFATGYGNLAAVRGVELELMAGEIVAVIGPNGSGKTTLLLGVAGELAPFEGSVTWGGHTGSLPLHKKAADGLAFVTEERSVFMGLTTLENLKVGGGDIDLALELFPELRPLLGRKVGLLSGGEQQILALARALSRRPVALLADELSLGLAPLVVQRLFGAVRDAAADGTGVLIVEQRVRDIFDLADRVVLLQHGEVALQGTADELRDRMHDIEGMYLSSTAREEPPSSPESGA